MATIWGGSVFYGGLLGASWRALLYLAPEGAALGPLGQPDSPGHPLFHVFGRVGCFLGGCCYGLPSAWGFVYRYSPVAEANGVSRFPVQLVEAAWNLVLFLLLARLQRRGRDRLLPLYLALYAPARFLLEFLRGDAYRGIFLGLSTSQWISLFLFPAALYALLRPRN
ncbi:MAG: prolipoprotein diacylglyceryl transferase family protein [Oscillospiraceae bacterium]